MCKDNYISTIIAPNTPNIIVSSKIYQQPLRTGSKRIVTNKIRWYPASMLAVKGNYLHPITTQFKRVHLLVNPADIEAAADDYAALSLDDKKRFLMEILDKNLLYVNYCDIDDEEFGISDEDKAFTRSFYREG